MILREVLDMAEEKKRKAIYDYAAIKRYRESKQKQISLSFKTEDYNRYAAYAKAKGLPFRAFIIQAIEEKIERG